MKRIVPGGVREAAEILIAVGERPHSRFHFECELDDSGLYIVRYDVTGLVTREIEEPEP